jgi:hypothetical protein
MSSGIESCAQKRPPESAASSQVNGVTSVAAAGAVYARIRRAITSRRPTIAKTAASCSEFNVIIRSRKRIEKGANVLRSLTGLLGHGGSFSYLALQERHFGL